MRELSTLFGVCLVSVLFWLVKNVFVYGREVQSHGLLFLATCRIYNQCVDERNFRTTGGVTSIERCDFMQGVFWPCVLRSRSC